jgi:hypothetical protein
MKTTKLTKLEQFVLDHENESFNSLAAQLNRPWRSIDQAHQRAIHKIAEQKRLETKVTPADEGFAASRAETNDPSIGYRDWATSKYRTDALEQEIARFMPRYVNMSAITDTATTISSQMWCSSQQDIYDAERTLIKWISKDEERWHGKVVFASMFDTCTKQLRTFKRDGDMLKEVEL